jgi:hypothetical protein
MSKIKMSETKVIQVPKEKILRMKVYDSRSLLHPHPREVLSIKKIERPLVKYLYKTILGVILIRAYNEKPRRSIYGASAVKGLSLLSKRMDCISLNQRPVIQRETESVDASSG